MSATHSPTSVPRAPGPSAAGPGHTEPSAASTSAGSPSAAGPSNATPFVPDHLLFGGDYNPEQWPRETWREDVELMVRAHVNTVTLGVFSWSAIEPEEGRYEFAWLDEVIGLLTEAGIGFFLATPTASPPPWFTRAHPEAMPVRPDGVRLTHGSRDTYAISAPAYREAARRVARTLADRYGTHPGLRGWHVHNEYGTPDWGPHAEQAFRRWLQDRYETLDALNDAWWSSFWSQHYGDWSEILPPRDTQYLPNPAQAIDFRRFTSDEMRAALGEQAAQIRAAGSQAPITTNFMLPSWNHLEQWSWAQDVDVVSVDHYLETTGPDAEAHVAYAGDLVRSWSNGPWVLMEQNPSGIKVDGRTLPKSPQRMIRNSLGYLARGSQSSLFFQWRQSLGGAEQWHGALVPHNGANSPTYQGAVELGHLMSRLDEIVQPPDDGPLVRADVGILWHADGWWALETPDLPNDHLSYPQELRAVHRAFFHAGIPVDFVRPAQDVDRYRLLVVPCQYALTPGQLAWLERYVESGGSLLVTYLTGLADQHLQIIPGGYPGMLRELLGIRGTEFHPFADGEIQEVIARTTDVDDRRTGSTPALVSGSVPRTGPVLRAEQWTERIEVTDADVLARYAAGSLEGSPAITRSRRGEGTATYLSARLDQESLDRFLAGTCARLGIAPTVPGAAEADVEAVRRRGEDHDFMFLLHHGQRDAFTVRADGVDLVTGRATATGLVLEPGAWAVVRVDRDAPVQPS
jgi:beta-galactosidase